MAAAPLLVDDESDASRHDFANQRSAVTKNDDRRLEPRAILNRDFESRLFAESRERFRKTKIARTAGSENDGKNPEACHEEADEL